jgi:hypothetical protein
MTEGRGFSNAKARRELGWGAALPLVAPGLQGRVGVTRAEESRGSSVTFQCAATLHPTAAATATL